MFQHSRVKCVCVALECEFSVYRRAEMLKLHFAASRSRFRVASSCPTVSTDTWWATPRGHLQSPLIMEVLMLTLNIVTFIPSSNIYTLRLKLNCILFLVKCSTLQTAVKDEVRFVLKAYLRDFHQYWPGFLQTDFGGKIVRNKWYFPHYSLVEPYLVMERFVGDGFWVWRTVTCLFFTWE